MNGPTTTPTTAHEVDPTVAENLETSNYVEMLRSCIPTLKAEYNAAMYMLAELTHQGDVQVKKRQFMKSAGRIVGGLPPMTDAALTVIASQRKK